MEKIKKDTRYILGQCQSFLCSYNAFNYCKNHKLKICTPCSVVFHCSCDIKIVNGKEFCDIAMEILEELVESLSKEGMNLGIDRYSEDYKESVLKIVDIAKELRTKYNHDEIDVATEDEYIKDLRKIIKDVLESQAYKEYKDFKSKIKMCGKISNENCDQDKLSFHNIRSEFYLNMRAKDEKFREKTLRKITEKLTQDLDKLKTECKNDIIKTNDLLSQASELFQNQFRAMEEKISNMFNQNKVENEARIEELKQELKNNKSESSEFQNTSQIKFDKFSQEISQNYDKLKDLCKKQKKCRHKVRDLRAENQTQHDGFNANITEIKDKIEELKVNQLNENQSLNTKISEKIDNAYAKLNSSLLYCDESIQNISKDVDGLSKVSFHCKNKNK